jgi:hypothetical protein
MRDIELYFLYSFKLWHGLVPYRDYPIEYPPLALVPLILPQIIVQPLTWSLGEYQIIFWLECAATIWLLWKWLSPDSPLLGLDFSHPKIWLKMGTSPWGTNFNVSYNFQFFATFVILGSISFERYDIFPAAATIVALKMAIDRKFVWTGVAIAIGIGMKLYPILLLPPITIYYALQRQFKEVAKLWISTIATIAIYTIPCWVFFGNNVGLFFKYHQQRGLQEESVLAGIILLFGKMKLTSIYTVFMYGSQHVVSPLAEIGLKYLPGVAIVGLAWATFTYGYAWMKQVRLGRYPTKIDLAEAIVFTLVIFMVFNKVFSPQYITWLLPFVALIDPQKAKQYLYFGLATAIFSHFVYIHIERLELWAIVVLNIRNFCLLAIVFNTWKDYKIMNRSEV